MQETYGKIVFALLRSAVNQTPLQKEEKALITDEAMEGVFRLAKRHDLAHLLSDALAKNGLLNKDMVWGKAFYKQQQTAIFRYEGLRFELEQIQALFEEEKVPFMPLKGSILRAYYPEPWMRTSCDIDVYVPKEEVKRASELLMNRLQYQKGEEGMCDVSFYSQGGVHVELHFDFLEEFINDVAAKQLQEVWGQAQAVREGAYQRQTPAEWFVYYHLIHTAKHFIHGGCGIRSFIDLWIINRRMPYDKAKVWALLKESGFTAFADKAEKLSEVWLSGAEHDEVTQSMQTFLFDGGVYGTMEMHMQVRLSARKNKVWYILSRIFLPYREMKLLYPSVGKCPLLYPIYTVRRWLNLIFVRGRAKHSLQELNTLSKTKENKETTKLFEALQLSAKS